MTRENPRPTKCRAAFPAVLHLLVPDLLAFAPGHHAIFPTCGPEGLLLKAIPVDVRRACEDVLSFLKANLRSRSSLD